MGILWLCVGGASWANARKWLVEEPHLVSGWDVCVGKTSHVTPEFGKVGDNVVTRPATESMSLCTESPVKTPDPDSGGASWLVRLMNCWEGAAPCGHGHSVCGTPQISLCVSVRLVLTVPFAIELPAHVRNSVSPTKPFPEFQGSSGKSSNLGRGWEPPRLGAACELELGTSVSVRSVWRRTDAGHLKSDLTLRKGCQKSIGERECSVTSSSNDLVTKWCSGIWAKPCTWHAKMTEVWKILVKCSL